MISDNTPTVYLGVTYPKKTLWVLVKAITLATLFKPPLLSLLTLETGEAILVVIIYLGYYSWTEYLNLNSFTVLNDSPFSSWVQRGCLPCTCGTWNISTNLKKHDLRCSIVKLKRGTEFLALFKNKMLLGRVLLYYKKSAGVKTKKTQGVLSFAHPSITLFCMWSWRNLMLGTYMAS